MKILYTAEEYEEKFGKDYLDDNPPDHEYYGDDNPYPTKDDYAFEDEIRGVFQSLIDDAFSSLEEEKILNEKSNTAKHFEKHCLGNYKDRKSRTSNIYYDFKTKEEYKQYANSIIKLALDTSLRISSLLDRDLFYKYIREFFEGNKTIYFTNSCEFHNYQGDTVLAIHSWANKVTKNYPNNTVDILVMSSKKVFLTIYSVDAHKLESKLNSIIEKYKDNKVRYKFNND